MRLLVKVTIPIIAMLVVAMISFVGLFYYLEHNIAKKNIEDIMRQKVGEFDVLLKNQAKDFEDLKNELNQTYISKAKTLSFLIEKKPDVLESTDELITLAKKMDVDEIHICDENGVLKWGSVPKFFGFDFNTSDQTKPFLNAIQDKNFELAQEAQPRGSDKTLFQYIGVARMDKPGIVQIGVKPERLQKELDRTNIRNVSKASSFSKNGFIIVVDKATGTILSHRDENLIGKKASDFEWGKGMKQKDTDNLQYTQGGGRHARILQYR